MKVFLYRLILCLMVWQCAAGPALAATLYEQWGGKTARVFIPEVADESTDHKIAPSDVKKALIDALKNRKSIRFEIVEEPAQADLIIAVKLKSFYWTDHDPVDMLMGVGGAATDAVVIEDYAKIEAEVVVKDAKKDKAVWSDKVIATITKKPMSEAESLPLIVEDFAKVFIRDCFGKKRR